MATWTASNRRDAQVSIHPPVILVGNGAQAGKNSYSGIFRAVRCTLTASGTYTAGGDVFDPMVGLGLREIDAILVVTDTNLASTPFGQLRWNTTTNKIQGFTSAGAEVTGALSGTFEVIILGR